MSQYDDPTLALLSPLPMPSQEALLDNQANLMRTYQDAAAMEGDMDKLQESIDQLVRSMGLDVPAGALYAPQGQGGGVQQQQQGQSQGLGPGQGQGSGGSSGTGMREVKVEPIDTPVSASTTASNTASAPVSGIVPSADRTASASQAPVQMNGPGTGTSTGGTGFTPSSTSGLPLDLDLNGLSDADLDLNIPESFDMEAFLNDIGNQEGLEGMGVMGGDVSAGQSTGVASGPGSGKA